MASIAIYTAIGGVRSEGAEIRWRGGDQKVSFFNFSISQFPNLPICQFANFSISQCLQFLNFLICQFANLPIS
jgi:hypothetical protein